MVSACVAVYGVLSPTNTIAPPASNPTRNHSGERTLERGGAGRIRRWLQTFPLVDDLARLGGTRRIDANLDGGAERQFAARAGEKFTVDARRDSGARQQVADHVRFDGERALVDFFAEVFHAASLPGTC